MAYHHKAQYLGHIFPYSILPSQLIYSHLLAINHYLYADDTQLFISLQPGSFTENISFTNCSRFRY